MSDSNPTDDLREQVKELIMHIRMKPDGFIAINGNNLQGITDSEAELRIMALINTAVQQTEKAYGDCHNCYGKGYASVIEYASGYDTDTDIGSPGGKVFFRKSPIKYCTCGRGKQLETIIAQLTEKEK